VETTPARHAAKVRSHISTFLPTPTIQETSTTPRSLTMSYPEQLPDINLPKYRQYVSARRRVSEWVQQTQHDPVLFHSAKPGTRKRSNTTKNGGKSPARRSSRSSRQSTARGSTTHEHRAASPTELRANLAPIPLVMALVSLSVMIWALDLLPSILALCGFIFILSIATTSVDGKVRWLQMETAKMMILTKMS